MKKLSFLFVFTLTVSLFLSPYNSGIARAEGTVEIRNLNVDGLVIGKRMQIDQEFAAKYKTDVKSPFEFIIPKLEDVKVFAAFPPETGGEYIKISYAAADDKLIENLRFVNLTVPLVEKEKRLAMLNDLLVNRAIPMAVKGYANPKFMGSRRASINGLDAVEAAARFEDPAIGVMYVWLVGILDPESENGVMAMNQIAPTKSEVKTPKDIGKKGIAVKSISTFKFMKE